VTDRAATGRSTGLLALAGLVGVGLLASLALRMGRPAPNVDMVEILNREPVRLSPFLDASGKAVTIESFRGRTVILNLWAPWCAPCLQEMPALDRLAGRLPEADFAVVAVTKDPVGPSQSKIVFDRMGLARLKLHLDPEGRLGRELEARGYPMTLIVGADGAALAYREGAADWDSDAMVAKLEKLAVRGRRAGSGEGEAPLAGARAPDPLGGDARKSPL
jgi:thiol-disulfide isomerase/thioredoxin